MNAFVPGNIDGKDAFDDGRVSSCNSAIDFLLQVESAIIDRLAIANKKRKSRVAASGKKYRRRLAGNKVDRGLDRVG